jgi:hypothetical protein
MYLSEMDIFLLMSKSNKEKSESDYKCCKLEIYKLTPSFRNSRLSSSEKLKVIYKLVKIEKTNKQTNKKQK